MLVIAIGGTRQHVISPATDRDATRTVTDLYAQRAAALVGFGRRLGLTEDEAWDAVQEAHVRLWRALCRGDEIRDPRAWVAATTYRLAMDQHRLARRIGALVRRVAAPAASARPDADAESTDRIAAWAAVDALPERQRAAIYLHYRLDLPFEEVAGAMGISAGAARTLASRGLATVRAGLADGADNVSGTDGAGSGEGVR